MKLEQLIKLDVRMDARSSYHHLSIIPPSLGMSDLPTVHPTHNSIFTAVNPPRAYLTTSHQILLSLEQPLRFHLARSIAGWLARLRQDMMLNRLQVAPSEPEA